MAKFTKLLLFLGILIFSPNKLFAMQGPGESDPLRDLNYVEAFNQEKIFKKYADLLDNLQCSQNVFKSNDSLSVVEAYPGCVAININRLLCTRKYQPVATDEPNYTETENKFRQECLAKLNSERRWAISKPARESAIQLGLMAAAVVVVVKATGGADSYGGGFSIFAALFNSTYYLKDLVRSGLNLAYPPAHSLDALEKYYAVNQCFIPKSLWPMIIEKFMMARSNQFAQRDCMEYLTFALGLTLYKPKKEIGTNDVKGTYDELCLRIDKFFSNYAYKPEDLATLKVSLKTFLEKLIKHHDVCPRYQYLVGPGGIGKTYFVKKLSEWLEELLPGSIYFEDIVVNSPSELDGNAQHPGAFLRVLRNQLQANKHGSVVFMDEATWLNNDMLVSDAKRVFNGNLAEISTKYFGSGVEGEGIKLSLPPMLIFVASNDKIKDEALSSRFDTTNFPMPKKDSLCNYAVELFKKSSFCIGMSAEKRRELEGKLILKVKQDESVKSFRKVEAFTEPFVLTQS